MNEDLQRVARHVNWYTDAHRVLADTDWFLAQVMARGSFEDILTILGHYSQDDLRRTYLAAPPGLFTRRAWAYWGLMLVGDATRPLPERFPGANRLDWRGVTASPQRTD